MNTRRIIATIFIILLLCSCSTTRYIEVPIETTRTEYVHDTLIDSIVVRDSVDRWLKGDTLCIYKEHTKLKYVFKTDTIVKVDTIPKLIKVETVKEVEVNHIKWYQETLMWIGGIMSLILICYIMYKIKIK